MGGKGGDNPYVKRWVTWWTKQILIFRSKNQRRKEQQRLTKGYGLKKWNISKGMFLVITSLYFVYVPKQCAMC